MIGTVTFDVFSALTNSRVGGSAFFEALASSRGWGLSGEALYDEWDSRNKARHALVTSWLPFREISVEALRETYAALGIQSNPERDSDELLLSMPSWPLWDDVDAATLRALPAQRLGLLSNIDDDLLAGTQVMRLGVFDADAILTSERLRAYKPGLPFYAKALDLLGPFVHVPSSVRDVEGTTASGLPFVQLVRARHAAGDSSPHAALSLPEVGPLLERLDL